MFGVLPAGHSLITSPSSTPHPNSVLYELPTNKAFSHLVVLLLPSAVLPPNTAAAIYLTTGDDVRSSSGRGSPNFTFLGGIGPGKESAVFKIRENNNSGGLVVGIEVEASNAVEQRMAELNGKKVASAGPSLVSNQVSTLVLAQRIIGNAFNFLAGFSGLVGADGTEVVPLKAFQEWWRKFESRVRSDPSFLHKEMD